MEEPFDSHIVDLIGNVTEVDRLRDIHSKITTSGPGRKHNVAVLHKSGIVLLVACWEAFVEDLVRGALNHMISTSQSPKSFPAGVLERVGSAHTGAKVWELAGDGWKTALRDNLKSVLAKTTGTFNTPKSAQVDDLFQKTLGLSGLSTHWSWKGKTVTQARSSLDDLVTLRGSIAHRVSTARAVRLTDVRTARELIFRLSVRSHNRTSAFLKDHVGSTPWEKVTFKGTS